MNWEPTGLAGHRVFTPTRYDDDRGSFYESFVSEAFVEANDTSMNLAQTNVSISGLGVLRGLHFRRYPPGRVIYVTCVQGAAFDVAVDIDPASKTFGKWFGVRLDTKENRAVSIREGLAHGFLSLAPQTTMIYLSNARYSPENEFEINSLDSDIGIEWPTESQDGVALNRNEYVRSHKDRAALGLAEVERLGLLPSPSGGA